MAQCDVIVHLAAMNRHPDPEVIYETNVNLVKQLITALEKTNSKAHVLFSSSSQEEKDNLYGKSKKEGRELLSNWAKNHGMEGPYIKEDNYDSQANENYAKNLKGHLMLVCGLMDNNVPPENTLLVVNALIKAHKDFDMFIIPNARHGYGAASSYWKNRRWAYFVKYLKGVNPPKDFELKGYSKFK